MGSSLLYGRLSWLRFYSTTGWDIALSCQPSAVSSRTASRAGWLPADLVCCPHRSLPLLSPAGTVSREPYHAQTPTSECSAVAIGRFSLGFLASSEKSASRASSGSGPLERLATLWNPARLAESGPKPNRPAGKLHPCRSFTCPGADLANLDPSEARTLASVLGGTVRSQYSPLRRSQAGRHAPRSPGHFCALFWL